MTQYKNIATGYINQSKNGKGMYLDIKNVSDEAITIEAGGHLFLNMTPHHIKDVNPKVPNFSKSIKIEEEAENEPANAVDQAKEALGADDISDQIPF